MGLPIKIVCAVNSNDIVYRTLTQGDYSIADKVIPTYATAMDIQVIINYSLILCIFEIGTIFIHLVQYTGAIQSHPAMINLLKLKEEPIPKTVFKTKNVIVSVSDYTTLLIT